jgi:hypothetical protein
MPENTVLKLVTPTNVDWQSWLDHLELPHGATLSDSEAVVGAIKAALKKQGHNIL